jgi:hypothetical protein
MPQPPVPPEIKAKLDALERIIRAISLLRDEKLIGFRVDIEVDSTIYSNSEQEKADRTEFLRATTDYLQQAMMMGQQMPELVPLLGKFLQFGVRSFKIGRDLESAIEEMVEELPQLIEKHMQLGAQRPPPDLIRAQAQMVKAQAQAGDIQSKHQFEMLKANADWQEAQQKAQSDQQKAQAEVGRQALENQGLQAKTQTDAVKAHAGVQKIQMDAASNSQQHQMDMMMKKMDMILKIVEMQQMAKDHRQERIMGSMETQQKGLEAQQAVHQVGIEGHRATQMGHQAQMTHAQQPIEVEKTKQAQINADVQKYRAAHPQPKSASKPSGGGENA